MRLKCVPITDMTDCRYLMASSVFANWAKAAPAKKPIITAQSPQHKTRFLTAPSFLGRFGSDGLTSIRDAAAQRSEYAMMPVVA
jgi:hypothetical protein